MILRMWRARATVEIAEKYVEMQLRRCSSAYMQSRDITAPTCSAAHLTAARNCWALLWESMEAVCKFAGAELEKAVVEPEAKALLMSFDNVVTHFVSN